MKAKTIFLTSTLCAILLAPQIGNPPRTTSEPSPAKQNRPSFSECLISDFNSSDKDQPTEETPHRIVTLPPEIEVSKTSTLPNEIKKTSTQTAPFLEPTAEEIVAPQSSQSNTPQMGDTRMVNGQEQVYFLGFGWIEVSDEPNECIFAEDMYENGNKIGVMGMSDGDINKMVGTMD